MAEYEWILVLRVAAGMGLTYLLIPLVIFSLLLSWNPIPRNRFPLFIIACFGIGPMLCSWLCQMIAWAVPGATPATCVAVIGSLAVLGTCVAAWRARTVRRRLRETFSGFTQNDRRRLLRETLIVVGVLAVGALAWFAAWTQIIRNSDYVYYLTNARFFFDGVPVSSYPFHHPVEPTDYYFPSMHPLGYHFLLYWSYALQGTAETTLLARSVGAFYFTMTGLLAWAVARRTGWVAALFAPLLLLSVRIFCVKAAEGGPIDAMRIFFDCLTVYLAVEAAMSQNRKVLLAAGLSLGFALNSHSIGFLMVVFAPMVYFVVGMRKRPELGWKRISLQALVPLAIAFFICGAHYVNNTLSTGKPVGDDTLVWDALGTQAHDIFRHARGLSTLGERINNGLLVGWTNTDAFGKSYWIMLGAILLFPRKLIQNPATLAALTMLALFLTLAVTSIVLGSDLIVKNPRYMQTIQPYVAIVAAIGLQHLLTFVMKLSIRRQLPLTAGMRIAWRLIRPFSKFSFRLPPFWLKMNRLAARAVLTAGLIALACYSTDAARKYPYNYWARMDRADILSELAFQGDLAAIQAAPAAPDAEFYAYVEEHVPPNATFLLYYEDAFRFYLKERRVIGHYNPHLLPLLTMKTPEEAFSFLERKGVDYVVVTPWLPPALTCSVMSHVVGDPQYSELQTDFGGYRLFRLKRSPDVEQRLVGVVTPTLTVVGKATAAIESEEDSREARPKISLPCRQTYVLSCEATGEGLATIMLSAGAIGGNQISPIQIWEGLIEREGRAIDLQFELPSIAANEGGVVEDVRFTVRLAGDGGVISPIRISEVGSQPKREPKVARQQIIDRLDRQYPGRTTER